jgi:hypothetical protein
VPLSRGPLCGRVLLAAAVAGVSVALAAVHVGAAADNGVAVAGDYVGVNTHLVWYSHADSAPTMQRVRGAGVGWVREELPWRLVEASRGSFDWTYTDALFQSASEAGLKVLGILNNPPAWASSDPTGRGDDRYPPNTPTAR